MTDNIELQPHIDKFDRLLVTATDFEEEVLGEHRGMIFTATFEVFLTADLTISASASVGPSGEMLAVKLYQHEYDDTNGEAHTVADIPVDQSNGLWAAMSVWLDAVRDAPNQV